MRDATIRYISAPLENLAGTTWGQEGLEVAVSQLASHSPNGPVEPTNEPYAVAKWRDLGTSQLVPTSGLYIK